MTLLAKELKDVKSTPTRHALPLAPGWLHHGPSGLWGTPVYYRTADGVVHVSGLVEGPSTSGSVIATLPIGYRPSEHLLFATDGHNQHAHINVLPNGDMQLESGSGAHISLNTISFIAA